MSSQSFAEYYKIGILVWSPLASGFLSGKYSRANPAPAGSRFAGQFVPFDQEMGYRVVDIVKQVSARHGTSPARVALAWILGRPAVSSVIIAARTPEHLDQNVRAIELDLSEDVRPLDAVSDPGVPYPKWMVLQPAIQRKIRVPASSIPSATLKEVLGRTSVKTSGPAERGVVSRLLPAAAAHTAHSTERWAAAGGRCTRMVNRATH